MKLSKVILLSTACSFCNAADCSYAAYNTSESLSLISTSGIHTYHTQHLTDETPFLPHPRAQFGNQWRHPRRHSQSDATHPGNTGENIESLSNLDVRIKSEHDIRVASVCFITDTRACSGEKFSNDETPGNGNGNPGGIPDYDTPQEQCQAAGYFQKACPSGTSEIPCPVDFSFHICTCSDEYSQTCEKPYYGVGEPCREKYKQCQKDTSRACMEENPSFVNRCPTGWQLDNLRCSFDDSFGICCNRCDGYIYTKDNIPNGYVTDGSSCIACGNKEKYKIKPAPCDGFEKCLFGSEVGAKSCLSGSTTMYDKCRPCSESCPSGTSTINPGGCGGTTTNECGTKTCYYPYESCCSDYCSQGSTWVYCSSKEDKVSVGTTDCGSTCYECVFNPCKGVSCGSNAYCEDGKCYCESGYYNSASGCKKATCSPYLSEIPENQICDTVERYGLTCYTSCSYYYTGDGYVTDTSSSCTKRVGGDFCSGGMMEPFCYISDGRAIVRGLTGGTFCCSSTAEACESCRSDLYNQYSNSCPSYGTKY